RLGVASRQRRGLVPARVDAGAIGTGRLGDGHGRAPDQLVQRWRGGGVAGVGEDAAAEVEAVAAAGLVAVDQLGRLLAPARRRPPRMPPPLSTAGRSARGTAASRRPRPARTGSPGAARLRAGRRPPADRTAGTPGTA